MALDYWIAVRRWMVVQEATSFFSPSRMVWSAWMVACLTICSCRYFFLPCVARYNPIRATSGQRVIIYATSVDVTCPSFPLISELIGDSLLCCSFTGSVSVGVWQIACRRLIVVGEKAVKNLAGLCHLSLHLYLLYIKFLFIIHLQHPHILTPRTITSAFLH